MCQTDIKYQRPALIKDILVILIDISILLPMDYFYFRFYELDKTKRDTYAGTGFMYEYQLKMNPKETRAILEDKRLFLKEYANFVKHKYYVLGNGNTNEVIKAVTEAKFKKMVLKSSDGQCGEGVEVIELEHDKNALKEKLNHTKNDLLEEYIVQQHDDLMKLSPSGLNTVRIFTQLNKKNEVDILGCRLRITINSAVDNLAAGNIAAPIDEMTGLVTGSGVYSDITKTDEINTR